jgi:hypothetical protein
MQTLAHGNRPHDGRADEDKPAGECHLLKLSDEMILNIIHFLPITSRVSVTSLHPRLNNVVHESWKHVLHFPAKRIGFRFHKNKKRVVLVEDLLPVVTKCKKLTFLRLPCTARDPDNWYDMGWRIGSQCVFIRQVVGQFNDIGFMWGLVNGIKSNACVPLLTEISVREIRTLEQLCLLNQIVHMSPHLQTCRILINSLPAVTDERHLLQLRNLKASLKSFITPQSLSSRIV